MRNRPRNPTLVFALAAGVLLASVVARAADPQAYTIAIDDTGSGALNSALEATSLLVTLREKAPAGPFALVSRAKGDAERLLTTLHSYSYYQAKVAITIADRD